MNIIENKISLETLRRAIVAYPNNYGRSPCYCVMSEETLKLIAETVNIVAKSVYDVNYIPYIFGVPVAKCEKLKLGEVEVVG